MDTQGLYGMRGLVAAAIFLEKGTGTIFFDVEDSTFTDVKYIRDREERTAKGGWGRSRGG